jgi:tetratricopeptide (TPR) repeat protein
LQRFLEGRPILARPPGPLRRCGKWFLRNQTVSAAGTVGFGSLLVIIGLIVSANKSATQKLLQDSYFEDAAEFNEEALDVISPEAIGLAVQQAIEHQLIEGKGRDLGTPTERQAEMENFRASVAKVDFNAIGFDLVHHQILDPMRDRVREWAQAEDMLVTMVFLQRPVAAAYARLGLYDEAIEMREGSEKHLRDYFGVDNVEADGEVHKLAQLLHLSGRNERALILNQRLLEIQRQASDGPDLEVATTLHGLGVILVDLHREQEAIEPFGEAAGTYRDLLRESKLDPKWRGKLGRMIGTRLLDLKRPHLAVELLMDMADTCLTDGVDLNRVELLPVVYRCLHGLQELEPNSDWALREQELRTKAAQTPAK